MKFAAVYLIKNHSGITWLDHYLHQDFLHHIQIQHPSQKLGFRLQPPVSNFQNSSYMSTFQHLDTVNDGPKVTGQ
jgi:hypothetical protein